MTEDILFLKKICARSAVYINDFFIATDDTTFRIAMMEKFGPFKTVKLNFRMSREDARRLRDALSEGLDEKTPEKKEEVHENKLKEKMI